MQAKSTRWTTATIVVTLMSMAASAAADEPTTGDGQAMSGTGHLECHVAILLDSRECTIINIGPDPNRVKRLDVGAQARATFTIEWTPVSMFAERLALTLQGNHECELQGAPDDCDGGIVFGPSPLSISAYGLGASNTELIVSVWLAPPCEDTVLGEGWLENLAKCRPPFMKVVTDQPFTFEWTLE